MTFQASLNERDPGADMPGQAGTKPAPKNGFSKGRKGSSSTTYLPCQDDELKFCDGGTMSSAVRRACEMAEALRGKGRPWSEILVEVESAGIRQGTFEPLYAGCEHAPYRIRFVPKERPRVFSKEFVERLTRLAEDHSLVVQTRCTGYNLFLDTGKPDGLGQRIRKSLRLRHKTKLLRVFWLDTYGIELEHPKLARMPEALEKIGSQLYGMAIE